MMKETYLKMLRCFIILLTRIIIISDQGIADKQMGNMTGEHGINAMINKCLVRRLVDLHRKIIETIIFGIMIDKQVNTAITAFHNSIGLDVIEK